MHEYSVHMQSFLRGEASVCVCMCTYFHQSACSLSFLRANACMLNVYVHEQGVCLLFLFPSILHTNMAHSHCNFCEMMPVRVCIDACMFLCIVCMNTSLDNTAAPVRQYMYVSGECMNKVYDLPGDSCMSVCVCVHE